MSSSPKIVVFKMREIIYTLLLLFLVVLLVVCLVLMFSKKKDGQTAMTGDMQNQSAAAEESQTQTPSANETQRQTLPTEAAQSTDESTQTGTAAETASYTPGVYTEPITLGDSTVDVEVTVDSNHINSIRLVNLSESTAASYPLVSPSLEHIASQILETQSLAGITSPQENRYTSQMLLSAVADALEQAKTDK